MSTKIKTPKQLAYEFFYLNAGFSYDPKTQTKTQGRAQGARMLAKAERDAAALGYSFVWDYDDSQPYEDALGDHEYWCEDARNGVGHEHEVWDCVAYDAAGNVVASLGAILDPSREYRRVIEAELALESLPR